MQRRRQGERRIRATAAERTIEVAEARRKEVLAREAEERKRHQEALQEEKASFRLASELQARADEEARTEENSQLEVKLEEIAAVRRTALGEEAIAGRKKEWGMEQRVREQGEAFRAREALLEENLRRVQAVAARAAEKEEEESRVRERAEVRRSEEEAAA